jgi:hypothetical protein
MIEEQKPKRRSAKTKPFGAEEARAEVLEKLQQAAAKGKPGFFTDKTPAAKREAYETALQALEQEQFVFADRSKAKPRYYLAEFQPKGPTPEAVSRKLAAFAAAAHPAVFGQTELKRGLDPKEKPLFPRALDLLLKGREFLALTSGKKELYLHLPSVGHIANVAPAQPALDPQALRSAYQRLVAQTRFPAVEIAALQRATGIPVAELQSWLLQEYQSGRVVLSSGDWSLSDPETRAGAIQHGGERFLLVRFQE